MRADSHLVRSASAPRVQIWASQWAARKSGARAVWWAAALGAGIVLLVGLPLASLLTIWIDEAFTLHTTASGPAAAFAQTIAFEMQPPLYFVLEALWRGLDPASIAFARVPSVIFAAATVATVVVAARRIAPRVPPVAVALVTALNPFVLWSADELRVYALVLLVGALLTWTFYAGFLVDRPARYTQLAYAAIAVAGLYTQYYVGFVVLAHALTLLAVRRSQLWAFGVHAALAMLAFAPFGGIALAHVRASDDSLLHVGLVQSLHEVVNAAFMFVLPHDFTWSQTERLLGIAVALVLVACLIALGRPRLAGRARRAFFLQWVMSLAVFGVVFACSGAPLDSTRHAAVLAPSSWLVALLFVSSLRRMRATSIALALCTYGGFAIAQTWTLYHPPLGKLGEWNRVAAVIASEPATPVAVFPAELALPLGVYSPATVLPVPRPMPFALDYVRATTLSGTADAARALDPVRARSPRLWLVTGGACLASASHSYMYNCEYLEAYLGFAYRLVRSTTFHGSLVRLYERRSADGK